MWKQLTHNHEIEPDTTVKCRNPTGYNITEGKLYIALYGLEAGIFEDRPLITFLDDKGVPARAHASRFAIEVDE